MKRRKTVIRVVRVDKAFMDEFKLLFFERLNDDEVLDKLVRMNDVGLERILYTSIDEECGQHGVLVRNELLKHFPTNNDNVEIGSIKMQITNEWQRDALNVKCKIDFSFKVAFPAVITIGDDMRFIYKDEFGRECDNEIIERYTNLRRMESTFEVRTVEELLDMTFKIFDELWKEGN